MRAPSHSSVARLGVLGCIFASIANAGTDQGVGVPANVNVITHAEPENGEPATNLLGGKEFFVCNSLVDGMDGHYVLNEDATAGADQGVPMFAREDDEDEGVQPGKAVATIAGEKPSDHDFRLMRRNGFWMFVDVAPWPPTTLFRCDPTKNHITGVDSAGACGMNLPTAPLLGYSPVDSTHEATHLSLHLDGCEENDSPHHQVVMTQANLSDSKDEL